MKLLLITQKVDRTDPILGFFHRWIAECAKHCEQVTVIGQFVGPYDLPVNVHVISLEKEKRVSRASQILHFWRVLWSTRSQYDAVLVHMTPIWVVLGCAFWMLLSKPMYLWYEARGTRWPLRAALVFVRKAFSASVSGMPLTTPKSMVVGHGIDTMWFRPGSGDFEQGLLISVGRITRSKRLEVLLTCMDAIPNTRLTLVGLPIRDDDHEYFVSLQNTMREKHLHHRVTVSPLTQEEVIPILQRAAVFIQASVTGLDKALLEAMSCGCPVVTTSDAAKDFLPPRCLATDVTLPERVREILALSDRERQDLARDLRARVTQHHSLPILIQRIVREMSHA